MVSNQDLDRQIESLKRCEIIKEIEVRMLLNLNLNPNLKKKIKNALT